MHRPNATAYPFVLLYELLCVFDDSLGIRLISEARVPASRRSEALDTHVGHMQLLGPAVLGEVRGQHHTCTGEAGNTNT
jgi:hypothetical protein